MKFTILTSLFFTALSVNAAVIESDTSVLRRDIIARQNAGRPVPNGGCCVANTSLKQDVCKVNGQSGRCVPAGVNNCEYFLGRDCDDCEMMEREEWNANQDMMMNRRRAIDVHRGLEVDLQRQGVGEGKASVQTSPGCVRGRTPRIHVIHGYDLFLEGVVVGKGLSWNSYHH